jgi:hypothetical protein
LVGVGTDADGAAVDDGVGFGGGGIPQFCSMQYELPLTSLHSLLMDGF